MLRPARARRAPPAPPPPLVNGQALQPRPQRAPPPIGRRHALEYEAVVDYPPLDAFAPQTLGTNQSAHSAGAIAVAPRGDRRRRSGQLPAELREHPDGAEELMAGGATPRLPYSLTPVGVGSPGPRQGE